MRGPTGSGGRRTAVLAGLLVFSASIWIGGAVPVRAEGSSYTVTVTTDEDSAYLGVRLREETEYPEGGARVTHVVDGSPADEAGIEKDDIVVRFGGDVIRGPKGLTERIHAGKPGDEVAVTVLRDGEQRELSVELGDRSEAWGSYGIIPDNRRGQTYVYPAPGTDAWVEWQDELRERLEKLGDRVGEGRLRIQPFGYSFGGDKPKLGVQLSDTTPELREHLGGSEEAGVLVSKVLVGSPAERAGVAVGDLIVSVGGEAVASHGDLVEALEDKEGESFPIEVVRGGKTLTIRVTIPKPDEDPPSGPRA